MQEDRQPNETRLQRKGDNRIPKVRSSANPKRFFHQQQTKKLRHKKPKRLRVHSDSLPGEQGPDWKWEPSSPRLRNAIPAQDKSATDRQLAVDVVSIRGMFNRGDEADKPLDREASASNN